MTTYTNETSTGAPAGQGPLSDPATLAGTWTVTSVIDGKPAPFGATLVFAADHTLRTLGPAGPDGEPVFTGDGHWVTRADGTFMYYLTHPLPDGSGGTIGTIHSLQVGTVHGETHDSSGSAVMHRADGTVEKPVEVTLTGTR